MSGEFRQYDEHGFPIAPRFEELKHSDDEPIRRPAISVRAKRWIVLGAVFGIVVPLVFGPRLLSMGRELLAQWYSNRAQKKSLNGDLAGALNELNCAIDWCPHDFELRFKRASLRTDQNDLTGSIEDWTECIRLAESDDTVVRRQVYAAILKLQEQQVLSLSQPLVDVDHDIPAMLYADRGWSYVRLGKTREALDDVNKAVDLRPTPENLNTRAYARAVLNVELKEGLDDIDKALREGGVNNPEMLDTRGYLLHRLDRNDEALADMNRAIKDNQAMLNAVKKEMRFDWRQQEKLIRLIHSLAVMYHHRGLIYQQLGSNEKADHDLKLSDRMGYNPAAGVM